MLKCFIVSSKQTTIYKNIKSITLPAFCGQMQVLDGHAESFVLFRGGDVIINKSSKEKYNIQVPGGECYIKDGIVDIIL